MSASPLAATRLGTSAAVCALLQSDGAGQPCPACQAAQARAHSPLFRAHCHGCKVRALAQGPQFWRSLKEGIHTDAYQGELAAVFGAAGAAAGHAMVLAEYRRLGALRDNAARCGVLSPGSRSDAIDGINTHNNHPGRAC
ncbi:hypothetical protein [Acidovorax sp. A1169]|uniref:hypothetical protein n=1 Tax=Acidovorax sp. A1169 TaxID=3059524 RepID=UPI002737C084|nr:hypothetical protein [Acidovorax sp. A1169]MDP4078917.1 hypothetical protein [Acidovorax sp. A1169]